jgi:hypothetical protein
MKIPTPSTALAVVALASTTGDTSAFAPPPPLFAGGAAAFIASSGGGGDTRRAVQHNSRYPSGRVVLSASADDDADATEAARRPEWSPSSWREIQDDADGGSGADDDNGICDDGVGVAKAARKISK